MKTLKLLLASSLLSGCLFTAKFDSVEYSYVTQLRTISTASKPYCEDPVFMRLRAQQIYEISLALVHYSEFLPRNAPTFAMSQEMYAIVEPLKARYESGTKVSNSYCQNKMDNIIDNSITMQKAMNARSR